jgi:hypothetical protein
VDRVYEAARALLAETAATTPAPSAAS